MTGWSLSARDGFDSRTVHVKTYVTRRLTVDAVQFNGNNTDEIKAFHESIGVNDAGELEAWLTDDCMVIRLGWWVHKDTVTGRLGLCTNTAFEHFFRELTARDYLTGERIETT